MNQPTRAQYQALWQLFYFNWDHRQQRPFKTARIAPGGTVYLEIYFPEGAQPIETGSSYPTYWILIDKMGHCYNDKPSDYEPYERHTEHRARLESFDLIWEG